MTAVTQTDLAPHRARPAPTPRLPDQVDIRFGDIPAIARFIMRADRALRDHDIRLSISTDFEEFLDANQRNRANDWFKPLPMFDVAHSTLGEANAFWLKGIDQEGATVLAHAIRLYVWPHSSMKEEVESLRMMYDVPPPAPARGEMTAPSATKIRGRVGFMGALWLHPRFRGAQLAGTVSPLTRALGLARWYPDVLCSFVFKANVAKGRAKLFGWPDNQVEPSATFYDQPGWSGPPLDGCLCYATRAQVEAVIASSVGAPMMIEKLPARAYAA